MSFLVNPIAHATTRQVHAEQTNTNLPDKSKDLELGKTDDKIDYLARAQWLRAAVLGANDGLVSVASLMIGVGAVSSTAKAMLVSGLAGLIAGACSMAIGEFVSVYTQYDIEMNLIEQGKVNDEDEDKEPLANPLLAAGASALAFSIGGILPLLAGAFIQSWGVRLGVVLAVTSFALLTFGWLGGRFGGAKPYKSALRVLIGGWMAMLVTFAILKVFGLIFHVKVNSSS
ncbi:Vacuolar iron transporter [Rhynchospora pubera]|uniref:Vacuolar iron transporter n=1 Tax=Rhynchospora pubera TaxID=906938 RepID=A0AAV8BUJ3_9POAL|nr:Vacuolar iron transporter [Rhynchospora pubera]